jgi:putative transposon-encoded protein
MIVSPDLVPNNRDRLGIVMQKILVVEQEILMLNRHEREHIAKHGEQAEQSTSCPYCQEQNLKKQQTGACDKQEKNGKKIATLNEIEREVEISGKNGCVLVPKTWAGKRVRIIMVEDDRA